MKHAPTIAVLGLGTMGAGMAHRLLGAGFSVKLYNRSADKYEPFVDSKAKTCKTPAEATSGADIVISMVSNDSASKAVWIEPGGALDAIGAGTIVIESSTVSLQWVKELSGSVERKGAYFLDAPVTGSKHQAETGALKFLVGGDPKVIEEVKPVLGAMSTDVIPLGPIGSGTAVKLVNNFICGVQVAALAEGLAMLGAFELNQKLAASVVVKGAAGSPLMQVVLDRFTAKDFTPNFALALMLKDLDYAINDAKRHDVALMTAEAARQRFVKAVVAGDGEKDIAALLHMLCP